MAFRVLAGIVFALLFQLNLPVQSQPAELRQTVESGQALLQQRKFGPACTAFEQAISIDPNFAPAHFFLGYALAQSGQNQRAITEFQTSLQLDPSMKEATLNIGSNYQSLGDPANAISWYERFLQENPGSPKSGDIRQRIHGLRQQMGNQASSANRGSANGGNMSAGYGMPSGTPSGTPSGMPAQASQDDYFAEACAGGRPYRWARMPIRVCIANGAGTAGYRNTYMQLLWDSFGVWANGSENRIAFAPAYNPAQADIVCEWTGDSAQSAGGGRAVEGGITKLNAHPQPNGDVAIASARITILTNRNGQSLSDDDMKKVCLHEVGHALGINGHSNNNTDVMFYSESPTVWPSLTKRDKATICHLYAAYPKLNGSNQ